MSLISFSTPSDSDVLKRIIKKHTKISFVGEGSVRQKVNETLYVRTIKIRFKKEEIIQDVIFVKKGISWLYQKTENVSSA